MKKQSLVFKLAGVLLYFSAFAIAMVSIMAFINPQDVMDLVRVQLSNTDAFSSIRGVYGGVGLAIIAAIGYCARNDRQKGMAFLSVLWGGYAVSRLLTIAIEGPLGSFGMEWLCIEALLCFSAISLFLKLSSKKKVALV